MIAIILLLLAASTSSLQLRMASPLDMIFKAKTGSKLSSIAVTGASGLVGSELRSRFESQGVKFIEVTTNTKKAGSDNCLVWNPKTSTFDGANALNGVDAVVHLAGTNVAGKGLLDARWSAQKKADILDSRVDGTKLLVSAMSKLSKKPKVFVSASAVGFYGYTDKNTVYDENSKVNGEGYLAEVCRQWEKEALVAEKSGIRTVCLRFAPIFSTKAGILAKLLPIFQLGLGGVLGDGSQGFSWVTLNDAVRAIEFAIQNSALKGPVNVCAPTPVTNEEFTKAMGSALSRPTIFPVPEFAAKTGFGEMGEEMLLGGQKVMPSKLQKASFKFDDADLTSAIAKLVR